MPGTAYKPKLTRRQLATLIKTFNLKGRSVAALSRVVNGDGTMYRAAQDLGVSQSSISRLAHRLESVAERMLEKTA